MQLPDAIGPVHFTQHGGLTAVRAPPDDPQIRAMLRRARATWDPGTRQWWVTTGRIERLVADLKGVIDPLFNGCMR